MEISESEAIATLNLDPIARWNVFKRLQELAIPCECALGQPLRVAIASPAAALQVWSVVQHHTRPRAQAIATLEHCWKQVAYR